MTHNTINRSTCLLLMLNCQPTQISGASAPTEHTFQLTEADLSYIEQDACAQTWVTGDAKKDLILAHAKLKNRGVKIRVGNPIVTATALARILVLSKNFTHKPDADKVQILSHELYHYCQRDALGDVLFEENYFHSAGRWRIEVPAYRQTFHTMIIQCVPISVVAEEIDARISTMRDTYLLWDLDPAQYETKTREIWRAVLDLDTPAHC